MNKQEVIQAVRQEYDEYKSRMLAEDALFIYDHSYEITIVKIFMQHIVYDQYLDDFTDDEFVILYNGTNGKILNYLTQEYWTSVYSIDRGEDVTALIDYCIRQLREVL